MSCVLSIGGEDFDAIAFLSETKLENAFIKLKGELINPRLGLRKISFVGVNINKIGFENLPVQIEEVISYLENHTGQLSIIKRTEGISFASLNFGVVFDVEMFRKKANKSFYWPAQLLKLAGDLGISIELALYAPPLEDD